MVNAFHQGDILKVEGIRFKVLVVSKDFFNSSGKALVCPVLKEAIRGPLHINILINTKKNIFVLCEQLRYLDLQTRGFSKISSISFSDLMNISDAIQGIFEYY